jgi:transcriptional regulator of acetoin/glycerol metabolism
VIQPADLGLPAAAGVLPDAEPDRDAIAAALARAGGVIAQAAADLGLSRQALYRRMERLGIARPA